MQSEITDEMGEISDHEGDIIAGMGHPGALFTLGALQTMLTLMCMPLDAD